jgi:hypothetical protein
VDNGTFNKAAAKPAITVCLHRACGGIHLRRLSRILDDHYVHPVKPGNIYRTSPNHTGTSYGGGIPVNPDQPGKDAFLFQ